MYSENLTKASLFKGFLSTEIEQLLSLHRHAVRKFTAKQEIVYSGEICDHLIIILSGNVKAEMIDDSGKIIKIEDLKTADLIAPAFVFAGKNEYPVTVSAIDDCELLYIEKNILIDLLQRNKQLLANYLTIISNRARFLSDKLAFLVFKTLRYKLAVFILDKVQEQKKLTIHIAETQQALADYFSVTRPSLARSLAQLEDDEIIEVSKKNIVIKDLAKLQELVR